MTGDIAIAHLRYPFRGGAERVAEALSRTFDAPIITAYADVDPPDDIDLRVLYDDPLLLKLAPLAWRAEHFVRSVWRQDRWSHVPDLHEFDTVIESVPGAGWYLPPDNQTLVRYVHSPDRGAYDLFPEYGDSLIHRWYAKVTRNLVAPTVPWADLTVCNSELVANRVRRYWGVPGDDIRVVNPPVPVSGYTPAAGDGAFVALSRLTVHKRFDVIVEAFRNLDAELRIIGEGPQHDDLATAVEDIENIELLGYVDEARKRTLLERARAFIYAAKNEDFGMAPIEAMAAGTPVIGPAEGFTQHQIAHGETGLLFKTEGEQTAGMATNLRAAITEFRADGVSHGPAALAAVAAQFSTDRFRREMQAAVEEARERTRITPTFDPTDELADANTTVDAEEVPAIARSDGGGEDS